MAKQTGKLFAFTCALLAKVLNASLNVAHDNRVLSRPIGLFASAGIKPCTMLAVLAVSMASFGTLRATAQIAEQSQAEPSAEQPRAVFPEKPTAVERESWRKTILHTPRPKKACYAATYPEAEWREVACKTPPHKLRVPRHGIRPLTVGDGLDFSATVTGYISEAEGSFDSVTGVTSESSSDGPDTYSLQLNTEFVTTTACSTDLACRGWEQFVFDGGFGFIQYWLKNYGPAGSICPSGWDPVTLVGTEVDCVTDSNAAVETCPSGTVSCVIPITSLGELKVTGTVAGVNGPDDSVVITVGSTAYSAPGNNLLPDLGSHWQIAEFNVLGDGGGNEANFNAGSTIVVRTSVDSGTTSGPGCVEEGFTAESNNLTLTNTTEMPSSSAWPSLVFTESNAPNVTTVSCASAISIGDTHLTTFDGLYYDFQASGEFVLVENGSDFVVQTRQASGAPTWPNAAVNKAVATQMGKSRVAVYIEPTRMVIDGVANDLADGKTIPLATGVQISRQGNLYTISSADGNRVQATLNSTWIDLSVGLGHAPLTEARGLLGNPQGNAQELATSNGVVLREPVAFTDLYHTYADSWRVQPRDSLFTEATTIKAGIPEKPFFARDLDRTAYANALATCKAAGVKVQDLLESCALDATVLNDSTAVKVFVHAPPPRHVIRPVLHVTH